MTCDDSGDICVVKQIQVPIQSPSESSRPERAVITGTSVSFSTSESESEESIEILQNPTKSELDENIYEGSRATGNEQIEVIA